ncbi:hypothetical protein U1Q18_000205 [Sarracenia purpurea var. burkii]
MGDQVVSGGIVSPVLQEKKSPEDKGGKSTIPVKACARHYKWQRVEIRGRDGDDRRNGNRRLRRALFTEDKILVRRRIWVFF